MFFVLNVGRSGSRSVAQVLSQAPDCTCLHEPRPRLIEEAFGYRTGSVDHDELVQLLRATRVEEPDRVRGETANRLAGIIPPLRDAFPDAALAWLVRDGRHVVSSAYQRGWYRPGSDVDGSRWDTTRQTAVTMGEADEQTWASWSQFERLCWYWASMNERIRTEADDPLLVRLEDLGTCLDELAAHVGITPTDFVLTHANRRWEQAELTGDPDEPVNPTRSNAVDGVFTVSDWDEDQHETFRRVCGPLMDELYPGWRHAPPARRTPATSSSGDGTSADVADGVTSRYHRTLVAVHEQLGELGLLRDELAHLHRERRDLRASLDEERQRRRAADEAQRGLEQRVRELEGTAEQADRARARIEDDRDRAVAERDAATAGLEESDARLSEARHRRDVLQRRLEHERRRREAITSSRAWRAAMVLRRASIATRRAGGALRSLAGRADSVTTVGAVDRGGTTTASVGGAPRPPLVHLPRPDGHGDAARVFGLVVFEADGLATLLAAVGEISQRHPDAAMLFITDSEEFTLLREAGALFEHVPPRARWTRHHTTSYDEFRARRLELLDRAYRPTAFVPMEASGGQWSAATALLEARIVRPRDAARRAGAPTPMPPTPRTRP